MYWKYWKTPETTLTTESNFLPGMLTHPIYPASSWVINLTLIFCCTNTHICSVENSNKNVLKKFNKLAAIFSSKTFLKSPLSALRQFLTIESPLNMMKNAFYFMLNVLFVFEIFTFLSWLFGCIEKRCNKKTIINFKIYDVTGWRTNNYSTYYPISQEVKAIRK